LDHHPPLLYSQVLKDFKKEEEEEGDVFAANVDTLSGSDTALVPKDVV
jgi:hypothetical protein